MTTRKKALLSAMQDSPKTPHELMNATGHSLNAVHRALQGLCHAGEAQCIISKGETKYRAIKNPGPAHRLTGVWMACPVSMGSA